MNRRDIDGAERRWIIISCLVLVSSLAAISTIVINRFGSYPRLIKYFQGEQLFVEKVEWNGYRNSGNVDCKLRFRNTGVSPVRILGFGGGCMYHTSTEFPVDIQGGDYLVIQISVDSTPKRNLTHDIQIKADIYTNLSDQATMALDYRVPHSTIESAFNQSNRN